jgi:magnesium chelatase family protein
MALAILVASAQLGPDTTSGTVFFGELSLDGAIKPTKGSLIAAQTALDFSADRFVTSMDSAPQAAMIEGVKVIGAHTLLEVVRHLSGISLLPISEVSNIKSENTAKIRIDFAQIIGQHQAKRALEIAASGGHNILFTGPPGTGKTLLAKSAMGILPGLSHSEAIEVTKIHSASHVFVEGLMTERPFRSPHHTASSVALIGGGSHPRPGEISLSHRGILFLDEIPEFPRSVLEVLRQPLEDGTITISRASGSLTFPANFMLIATSNPCPCGYFGDDTHKCVCSLSLVQRYAKRLSGPLLDRIDIVVEVPRLPPEQALSHEPSEASASLVWATKPLMRLRNEFAARFTILVLFCRPNGSPST